METGEDDEDGDDDEEATTNKTDRKWTHDDDDDDVDGEDEFDDDDGEEEVWLRRRALITGVSPIIIYLSTIYLSIQFLYGLQTIWFLFFISFRGFCFTN